MSVLFTAKEGRDTLTRFDRPRVILVEGSDDRSVVAGLIIHKGLRPDEFHVHNMIGKNGWTVALKAFALTDGFENVRSLGLIRDADADPVAAWNSCRDSLKAAGLPVPTGLDMPSSGDPRVAVTLIPSGTSTGALEELCIESFAATQLACVDSYFACVGGSAVVRAKERVQVYLAGMPRPSRDLRVAAERQDMDFAHSAFDGLRAFLRMLI